MLYRLRDLEHAVGIENQKIGFKKVGEWLKNVYLDLKDPVRRHATPNRLINKRNNLQKNKHEDTMS